MTAQTLHLALRNADTSVFASIHNSLIACGLVATTDTGQLDMTSAPAYVTTLSNVYGYTVYKFNDTAQSTTPIFLRIDWKNNSSTSGKNFQYLLTAGTGSNGSGTITGSVLASSSMTAVGTTGSTSAVTQTMPVFVCGDGSGIAMVGALDDPLGSTAQLPFYFVVDRYRDSSGAAKTTGWWLSLGAGSASGVTNHIHVIPGGSGSPVTAASAAGIAAAHSWILNAGSESNSGVIPVFPMFVQSPATENSLMAVAYPTADIGLYGAFQIVHLGSTHTYVACGSVTAVRNILGGKDIGVSAATNATSLALLFE